MSIKSEITGSPNKKVKSPAGFFQQVKSSINFTFGRLFQTNQDQLAENVQTKSNINPTGKSEIQHKQADQDKNQNKQLLEFDGVTRTELPEEQLNLYKGLQNEQFLSFDISSLYQYGKLRQDSEQILPIVLRIKTNQLDYQLNNQEQALDIMCMFDSSINNNELPMIEMKNALQILMNYVNTKDRLALTTQNKILKSFENGLSLNEIKELINNTQVAQKQFFKLNYLSQLSQQIQMTRKKKQNDIILIILYPSDNKVGPDILDWIQGQSIFKNVYILEFGNYQNQQLNYPNIFHAQITDNKILFATFYEIFKKRINVCCLDIDIMIQGVYTDDISQVKINKIYGESDAYNNKPESHNQLKVIPFNTEFVYIIELILPKSKQLQEEQFGQSETITGGEDDHKVRILSIQLNYVYRNLLYQVTKHLEIVLVGFQNDIPFNSLNFDAAEIYYKEMAYNIIKQMKQVNRKDETRQMKNWLLMQMNKHQQIKNALQSVIELVNKCN